MTMLTTAEKLSRIQDLVIEAAELALQLPKDQTSVGLCLLLAALSGALLSGETAATAIERLARAVVPTLGENLEELLASGQAPPN